MDVRTDVKTVAVFGAGTMGSGIAQVFAQNGRAVLLQDALPGLVDKSIARIGKILDKLVTKEKITADAAQATMANLKPASVGDAKGADLIIEAIIEDPQAKRELLTELNAIVAPDVIFTSNTSSISINATSSPPPPTTSSPSTTASRWNPSHAFSGFLGRAAGSDTMKWRTTARPGSKASLMTTIARRGAYCIAAP